MKFPMSARDVAKEAGVSVKMVQKHHRENKIGTLNRWGCLEFTKEDLIAIIGRKRK